MIVETTSCAPTVALRMPAIPAQAAPASVPATRHRMTCAHGLRLTNDDPSQTAKIVPAMY